MARQPKLFPKWVSDLLASSRIVGFRVVSGTRMEWALGSGFGRSGDRLSYDLATRTWKVSDADAADADCEPGSLRSSEFPVDRPASDYILVRTPREDVEETFRKLAGHRHKGPR